MTPTTPTTGAAVIPVPGAALAAGSLADPGRPAAPGATAAALLRVTVWFLLWATILRAFAAAVGLWAAGALDDATTIFVGVLCPAWVLVLFPTWFGWRVLGPWGLRRLALAACWLSPLVRARDVRSIRVFMGVAADLPLPPAEQLPADAWTALAAALQAERQGSRGRTEQIVEALLYLPPGARFPWLARVHGVEALVRAAGGRGDWTAAARYAQLGGGRLGRLAELLARAEAGEPVRTLELWLRWALAPMRLPTYRLIRALEHRRGAPRAVTPPPSAPTLAAREEDARPPDPRLRHVLLLGAAARGERVAVQEVFALAGAWQDTLGEGTPAELAARGRELGVRDGAEVADAIRRRVREELTELAHNAEGALPAGAPDGSLVAEVASRARDRLFAMVGDALSALAAPRGGAAHPLEAWERWLALRSVLERVEHQAGRTALTALWHGGVRDAVWSWACAVFTQHGARSGWVTHAMFAWVADRAECLDDVPTMTINRENARIALAAATA